MNGLSRTSVPPDACRSRGLRMVDLASHQCRFPLHGDGEDMRFCAVEIAPAEWLPGLSLGSYCRFHRNVARGGDAP